MFRFIKNLNNNPIYLKEIRVRERVNSRSKLPVPTWTAYFAILFMPLAFTMLMNTFKQRLNPNDLKSVFLFSVLLQVIYYIYRGASSAWGLTSGEKEMKTYGNLFSTGMSPDEIVKGKFWAAFLPSAQELTILFPVFAAIGLLLRIQPLFLFEIYLLTLIFTAFFSMVGTYFSIREKTSAESRNNTIRTIAVLLVGIFLVGSIISYIAATLISMNRDFCFHHNTYQIFMAFLYSFSPLSSLWAISILISAPKMQNFSSIYYSGIPVLTCIYYITGLRMLYLKSVKRIGELPE